MTARERCERCGTRAIGRREVNWSCALQRWLCIGCYLNSTPKLERTVERDTPRLARSHARAQQAAPSPHASLRVQLPRDNGPSGHSRKRLIGLEDSEEVAKALGMGATEDACPLPGHSGRARIEPRNRHLQLTCQCREGRGSRGLAAAFAAIETGQAVKRLGRGAWWLYTLLLAHRAGLLEPQEVRLGELTTATADMREIADDVRLLLGLKRAAGDSRPLAYSDSFAAARCGFTGKPDTTRKRARRALDRLLKAEVIKPGGSLEPSGCRAGTQLYDAPPEVALPAVAGPVEARVAPEVVVTGHPPAELGDDALMPDAVVGELGLDALGALVSGAAGETSRLHTAQHDAGAGPEGAS